MVMASNNVCAQNGDVLKNDSNQILSSKYKCQIAFQQHINVKQFLCEFWCSGLHIPKEATVVLNSKFSLENLLHLPYLTCIFSKCCGQLWVRHMICGQTCDELYHFTSYLIVLGYFQDSNRSSQPQPNTQVSRCCDFLPTGLHGLCFGFCFVDPLPLRSLSHGPLLRVHFGESLVIDYTQKSTMKQ